MDTVWELPAPSTSILEGPTLTKLPGRILRLVFCLYQEPDEIEKTLQFSNVEAYKCTFLTACNVGMIKSAYDKVVDCGQTEWLQEVQDIADRVGTERRNLHHYRIFFDEGPCYEVISEGFNVLD